MATFFGMRSTEDFTVTGQRPKHWREGLLFFEPNGSTPLLGMVSKIREEMVTDPEFNIFYRYMEDPYGAITAVYTDAAMTTLYTSGGVSGQTLYVKAAEAVAGRFVAGHTVMLGLTTDPYMHVNARVTDVQTNGANSRLTVKLHEADDNSSTNDLSNANRIAMIGSAFREGSGSPDGVAYDPNQESNYVQIFKTAIGPMADSAMKVALRTGDPWRQLVKDASREHGIGIEYAFWFGNKYTEGSGNQTIRTTGGILNHYIQTHRYDFQTDTDYSGQDWLVGGEDFLAAKVAEIAKYKRGDKAMLGFCGKGAMLGLDRLARANGHYTLQPRTRAYGIKVMEWITPFGDIDLITHPLLTWQDFYTNNMIALVDPRNMAYMYRNGEDGKRDFMHQEHIEDNDVDGRKDQFLTECGLELHNEKGMGVLFGIGSDNTV